MALGFARGEPSALAVPYARKVATAVISRKGLRGTERFFPLQVSDSRREKGAGLISIWLDPSMRRKPVQATDAW